MDSLNTIPNSGSFGDVSAKLNDNFSKVGQSLTTLENTRFDSAYSVYVETTTDNPVKTKEEWADSLRVEIIVDKDQFAKNTSISTPPATFTDTVPSVSTGEYLWVRRYTSYSDGTVITTPARVWQGDMSAINLKADKGGSTKNLKQVDDEKITKPFENTLGRSDRLADKTNTATFTLSDGVYTVTNGNAAWGGLIVVPRISNKKLLLMFKAKLYDTTVPKTITVTGYANGTSTLVINDLNLSPQIGTEWTQINAILTVNSNAPSDSFNVDFRFMTEAYLKYQLKDIVICNVDTPWTTSKISLYNFAGVNYYWQRFYDGVPILSIAETLINNSITNVIPSITSSILGNPFLNKTLSVTTATFTNTPYHYPTNAYSIVSGKRYLMIMKVVGDAYNDFDRLGEITSEWYFGSKLYETKTVDAVNKVGVLSAIFKGENRATITLSGQSNSYNHTNPSILYYSFLEIADLAYDSSQTVSLAADITLEGGSLADYLYRPNWGDYKKYNRWNGKKVLCIGDSLTAAGVWQQQLSILLGMTVSTHALGGIGLTTMVDGNASLPALTSANVEDKDLIILFGGYNDRHLAAGDVSDMHPAQSTFAGAVNYVLKKIYQLLATANNLDCEILVVTPHCAGKYQYIDVDGYSVYGTNTLLELCDTMEECANMNNMRAFNLWRESGIGRYTWSIYSASPTATNTTGAGDYPYPFNNDQLHLNNSVGYPYLGRLIANYIASF